MMYRPRSIIDKITDKITPNFIRISCAVFSIILGLFEFLNSPFEFNILASIVLFIFALLLITQVIFKHIHLPYDIFHGILLLIFLFVTINQAPLISVITLAFLSMTMFSIIISNKYSDK